MGKRSVIAEVVRRLRERHDRMLAAGRSSEDYATDDESRAEDKYDTRGLEASYLAAGQARQVAELAESIQILEDWSPADFPEGSAIGLGALVEAEVDGVLAFFLMAPAGGGTVATYLGCELTVLTMDSPLARSMAGRRTGDAVDGGRLMVYGVE